MNLDLEDKLVREMAERNHRPEEIWLRTNGGSDFMGTRCEECHKEWPCETRQALRDREDRKLKEHHEFLDSLSPGARRHMWWL